MLTDCQPGTAVELIIDANLIPAGRYCCVESFDELLVFSIGSGVTFGLARKYWSHFLRPITEANPKMTSTQQYVERYAELMRDARESLLPTNPSQFTFCMLALSVHEQLESLLLEGRGRGGKILRAECGAVC
jgi:hypothetical protein